MNQNDRQFITDTIDKALKTEVPVMIKTALDASNIEMKQFIVEHVSNEINDLAMITAKNFQRVDDQMLDLKDEMNSRFDEVNRKIEYIGDNYVRNEEHSDLERRFKKLELSRV